jgi:molybdopterin synthase catalytic subunit
MEISIELTLEPIPRAPSWPVGAEVGSLVEFFGLVRGEENGAEITALDYEAYEEMAKKIMREKILRLGKKYPCRAVRVVHRTGRVPVGESAIYVGVQSRHRQEGFLFLQEFMDELKRDVPIWKRAT